jgi:hypothetical protein
VSNRTHWHKHRLQACRKCGAETGLTKWFSVLFCQEHLPERPCLDCKKRPSEVPFRVASHRRCIACERAHLIGLHRGYVAKKPKRRPADSPHVKWVRTLPCLIHGKTCGGGTAHHVRIATGGGTALRPDDRWCVPLCHELHMEGHDKGWLTFQAKYRVDLRAEAAKIAALSPCAIDKPVAGSYGVEKQGVSG